MLDENQTSTPLNGLVVQDALMVIQVIRRIVKSGILEDQELLPLGILRQKITTAIKQTTGVDYDSPNTVPAGTPLEQNETTNQAPAPRKR